MKKREKRLPISFMSRINSTFKSITGIILIFFLTPHFYSSLNIHNSKMLYIKYYQLLVNFNLAHTHFFETH